jgi:hypothetical protein
MAPGRLRLAWAATALALVSAAWASGCGDTLQDQPVAPGILEPLVVQRFPVYWLGGSFHGLPLIRVGRDPSGAYEIQYGNCVVGGESSCVTPLDVVTSPDNSFLPGGGAPRRPVRVRGVPAMAGAGGATLVVATGSVVVDLYANTPALAAQAAAAMVALGGPGAPGEPLPKPLPDTGFAERPLPSQQPAPAPMGASEAPSMAGPPR